MRARGTRDLVWAPIEVLINIALTVMTQAVFDQMVLKLDGYDAGECEPINRGAR